MTAHQLLAQWSSWGWPLLANHLWQATLLSLVALGSFAFLNKAPGRARYAMLLIASAKFALPSALVMSIASRFGVDFSSFFTRGPVEAPAVIYQLTAPLLQLEEPASATAPITPGHNELYCVLTIVWVTAATVLLAMWWRDRRRFRLATKCTSVAGATRETQALDRVRSWLGIKRNVRLRVLSHTIEPGVWGVWSPVLLLPESITEQLSDAELEAVVLHEMVHVARWDNLVANLHRLLCCLLWFHPIVWLLDRLLLAERERACDDEVIRLSGASDVYASSLLKVLRLCLGWSVAGASNATGSNLGRRVERIMFTNLQTKLSVWHRVAVGSIALLVIILSIAAGLLTRTSAVVLQDNLIERLEQAEETSVDFKNSAKAPLVITDAKVKQLLRENSGEEFAVVPIVTVTNNTDRRITGFSLEFRNGSERRDYFERVSPTIDSRATYTSGRQKRFIVLAGGASAWSIRVAGVLFEDGDAWGMVPPPPPPPPRRRPDSAPPPPPPPPDLPKVIRKSGGVLSTSAIKRVDAQYPEQAKAAGVSGAVVVEITVDETGSVIAARAISGHPLLKAAAVDAARQWQFTPTTLSGETVKVVGTLTFNFEL